MADLYASGRIIDVILVLVVVEAVLLWWWRRRARHGPSFADLAPTLASGALLLLALRATIAGLWWGWTALALSLALLTHLLDLYRRFRADR